MHILTKIFIVLVSLMAVLLVPLVVVYAYNEDSYKAKTEIAISAENSAKAALTTAQQSLGAQIAGLSAQIDRLESEKSTLRTERSRIEAEVTELQAQLADARALQSRIDGRLGMIENTVAASQNLNESLVDELRDVRKVAMDAEKQRIELDEALRESTANLDVAVQARRALQEELQRVKEERDASIQENRFYIARYGRRDATASVAALGGITPDRPIDATVVNVRRGAGETLADLNIGSRDGVQEGWRLLITDGVDFVADIDIIRVDINTCTGRILLEDSNYSGKQVGVGMRAFARPANR